VVAGRRRLRRRGGLYPLLSAAAPDATAVRRTAAARSTADIARGPNGSRVIHFARFLTVFHKLQSLGRRKRALPGPQNQHAKVPLKTGLK
jgi:hypothetical protein